uniref:NB-ARC domain-containing protein n=1 Tax=Leersia perrieri TaxID=77586 RepID=A0A0D9Y0B7_9ORYZ
MGGIGKTALIQDVYRSEKVPGIFDKLACVTIMRPFNPNDLLIGLLKQLVDPKTLEGKLPSLASILEGKKYMIVLDDVLSATEWDAIKSQLPTTKTGRRILVTTRDESIAKHCSGGQEDKVYKLDTLGHDDAKNLFTKKVFKEPTNLDELELHQEAKLILKKCGGLPLAIVTIGGFLASRPKTISEWRKLNEHISAELHMDPKLGTIRTVLDISYDGLPYHLKSCFLYLSIFPEDRKISRNRLVRRWAAEGYSRDVCGKSVEEIADDYFSELIARSMIIPTQRSTYRSRGIGSCQVHDLMRDIAISKSKEENLVLRFDGDHTLHNQGTFRHLAITNSSSDRVGVDLEAIVDMSRIRSLTVFGEWRSSFISDKMRLLRVLDLEDTKNLCYHHIKHIGRLLHLRYLSLRGCEYVTFLPDSLGKLRQLETLDIQDTLIVRLPRTIINLRKLNYLRAGQGAMRLDYNGVVAPRGLRRLTALHTLSVVDIAPKPSVLQDISRLTQLRKLGVTGVNKKNNKKFLSALAALSRLESLSVRSEGKPGLWGCLDVADDKFSPPKDLKSLKLYGNLVELPKWIRQLKNLVKLNLRGSFLKDHGAAIQVLEREESKAMEATVLSIGKLVLNGAVNYAKSTVVEEVSLQLGVQRDHAFIRDELEMMQSFLEAAHDQRDDNKVVRDVAYDVEDCLQDFAVRLGRKKSSWWLCPRTLWERHRISKGMKELRDKVEDVSQRNLRYHLIKGSKPTVVDAMPSGTARLTMSGMYEAQWQEEKAKADLIRQVNHEVEDRRVIAVWGTCDYHRVTSIVGRAYDHLKRSNKFECFAWVDLMHPLPLTELLQTIVRQLYIRSLQESGKATPACQLLMRTSMVKEDHLADEFNTYLSDKCYLIVLNGLSTTKVWEQIKMLFPDNKNGSKIIVSTQHIEVAILCAGTEEVATDHIQLFADQTLYVFHYKVPQDRAYSMGSTSSLNVAISYRNNSADGKSLTRMQTMVAAFRESDLIGRASQKEEIIELILKDSQHHRIISLWGMGGIGKTALIQDVYRSAEVQGIFDKLACATIMRPFNPKDLLTSLMNQLQNTGTSLADILEGKKYLIVLDDLLFTAEWDAIKLHFPAGETGSRIIVTTRHENVAEYCSGDQKENMYKLDILADTDAENLLMKKILKKCGGLPLAIVTIGGFLASRPKVASEWRKLNDHINAELEMNPELWDIRIVLNISYNGLPYYLKSCFLYLSIFPEDYEISRKRLVRRWTAEGYSRGLWDKSAEDIADSYFFELLDRSMMLPTQKADYSSKGADSCKVHDIMREIAISNSKEENLVLRLDGSYRSHSQVTVRHLVITNDSREADEGELESTVDMSRVRSLTVFGYWRPFFISDKMKFLRVLDSEGADGVYDHHIKQIGKLIHLKYLSLRGCEKIAFLPDSLGNLRQLETLDIRQTGIIRLPKTIINLRKLNYLRAGERNSAYALTSNKLCSLTLVWSLFRAILVDKVSNVDENMNTVYAACTTFWCIALPSIAMDLNSLGVVAPRGLRRLSALHTLGVVHIAHDSSSVLRDIKKLTQLRKLRVTGIDEENSQKFFSTLSALINLESLSVSSEGALGLEGCLDADDMFSDLRSLKLYGSLVELPNWIQQLRNLVKLKLDGTLLKDCKDAIQVLGKLPNLAILYLASLWFEDGELHFLEESFPTLMVLDLDFGARKDVTFDKGAVQKLELLLLSSCGLKFLPSIKEVRLKGLDYRFNDKEDADRWKEDFLAQLSQNPKKPFLNVRGTF